MVRKHNADILCLQETKKVKIDNSMCQAIWGEADVCWEMQPSINTAGGLLCLWNGNRFKVERKVSGRGFILLEGVWKNEAQKVHIINIYAPCDAQHRRELWDSLKQLKSMNPYGLWCLMGDFNSIRNTSERMGLSQRGVDDRHMIEFNEWIADLELEEPTCVGRKFTWFRPNGAAKSRLDRALVTAEWLNKWPSSSQFILNRNFSDHCPILLISKNVDWGPKPFRIFDCWLQEKSFRDAVTSCWSQVSTRGWGGFVLKEKIKHLKQKLKLWHKEHFGGTFKKVQDLEEEINKLEIESADRQLSSEECMKKKKLQQDLWLAAQSHESIMRQKARSKWVKEGDCNSRYFHLLLNSNRRSNAVNGVHIEAQVFMGGDLDQRKIAWVKWDSVCLPKEKGGLGIKDVRNFNKALLGKWKWDMIHQERELWARILESKYGGWRALAEGKRDTNDSLWWQDLMVVTQEQQLNNVMQSGLSWNVGSGDKIKFWEDCWNGEGVALMQKFPRLYQISRQQHKLIQQVGSFSDTSWEWNLTWRRQLFDNEADSAYEFMRELSQLGEDQDGAVQDLWKLKIPAKASIFAWRLIRDRLPTKSNLHRRQVVLEDALCPFCRIREEDASHIFFECNKILPLWWESQTWVRSLGVFPMNTRQHFLQHVHGQPGSQRYNRWKTWWIALTWSIWKHRNEVIFQNAQFNRNKLLEDAVFVHWTWLRAMEKDFSMHYNQWSAGGTRSGKGDGTEEESDMASTRSANTKTRRAKSDSEIAREHESETMSRETQLKNNEQRCRKQMPLTLAKHAQPEIETKGVRKTEKLHKTEIAIKEITELRSKNRSKQDRNRDQRDTTIDRRDTTIEETQFSRSKIQTESKNRGFARIS
ncbi:putative ribonuclease H protein [Glycine soja]